MGDLDCVIQIDSPSNVSSFLQRMGRTGRRTGARRNCLSLTTNDTGFLLALGVTIVAQQALVASIGRGELSTRELVLLLQGSFPKLQVSDIESLIEHLI